MVSLSTLTLVAALAAGQTGSPAAQMKMFQPLIGQWIYIGTTQSDTPAFGPQGTDFCANMTFTWAIGRNAVQIRWSGKAAGKEAIEFVELIGWDAKQNKIVSQGFNSVGGVEHNVWSRDGETAICESTGIGAEGKDVTIRYENTVEGDILIFRIRSVVVDGEKKPDEEYKYRRVR